MRDFTEVFLLQVLLSFGAYFNGFSFYCSRTRLLNESARDDIVRHSLGHRDTFLDLAHTQVLVRHVDRNVFPGALATIDLLRRLRDLLVVVVRFEFTTCGLVGQLAALDAVLARDLVQGVRALTVIDAGAVAATGHVSGLGRLHFTFSHPGVMLGFGMVVSGPSCVAPLAGLAEKRGVRGERAEHGAFALLLALAELVRETASDGVRSAHLVVDFMVVSLHEKVEKSVGR